MSKTMWLVAGFAAAACFSIGVVGGVIIEAKGNLVQRVENKLNAMAEPSQIRDGFSYASNKSMDSTFHRLQLQEVQLLPLDEPFVIAEFREHIFLATHTGHIGVLDGIHGGDDDPSVSFFDARAPMRLEELRESNIWKNPLFVQSWYRTHDIHVEPLSQDRAYLYVSHHRFAGDCIELVVSRAELTIDDSPVLANTWEDVFVARPCISPKSSGSYFAGLQAGGRMASPAPGVLLLSTGDHQLDGVLGPSAVPMDPESDLGKIMEIDTETLESEIYAIGVRNPQGLAVASDGTIWETEHGPKGGDELNMIRRGANYGWPKVTYGMLYGFPVRDWPLSSNQGRHDGYVQPAMAFVPSIATSNLVEADPREFPNWRGDLIIATLRAKTLYRVRREGERVVYVEPIEFPEDSGHRMRDIISLSDGRLAMATDTGGLLLIANAESDASADRAIERIADFDEAKQRLAAHGAMQTDEASELEQGRMVFGQSCASCHTLSDEHGVGPSLKGVVGRPIGSLDNYAYSDALREAGGAWTEEELVSFLNDPPDKYSGTAMPRVYLVPRHYTAVVEYLKQADEMPSSSREE